jgi:hypothetical protein
MGCQRAIELSRAAAEMAAAEAAWASVASDEAEDHAVVHLTTLYWGATE